MLIAAHNLRNEAKMEPQHMLSAGPFLPSSKQPTTFLLMAYT